MFCFKQNTAYGMRISDWSSDVCSSDLRIAKLGLDRASDGGVEIRIIKDNEWRVAAEFETELLDRRRALRIEPRTDFGRAGERQLAHRFAGGQDVADLGGTAGDDVEQAIGQAG